MADMVQLEPLTPDDTWGVLLEDDESAIKLWRWARGKPNIMCRLSDKRDGTWEVQIEGTDIGSATATQGQWLVLNGKQFQALSPTQYANKYKIKGT